jgi:hypothetical protein
LHYFKKKFPTRIAKLGKFKIKKHVGCWGGGGGGGGGGGLGFKKKIKKQKIKKKN